MRIGIDARPLEGNKPTGIGVYLINVIEYIISHDKENEWVLYSTEPLLKDYSSINNKVISKVIKGKIGTLWVRYTLPKYIKKDHIDVFWGTQHILPKKVKGIRNVVTVHDLALMINPKWGSRKNAIMQNTFAKASIKDADFIIADSDSTKRDIISYLKIKEDKIKRIYIATSINDLDDSVIGIKKFPTNNKYFLYIGTIEPRKNITNLIKAFNKFADVNDNVLLLLAGGLGWRYEPIIDEYNNSPHKDKIHILGYISKEEKQFLLKNCVGFVFPSNYEGFGIPPLEAMKFGKPVILSNVSSLPEIGKNVAFYTSPDNPDEMKECMNKVYQLTDKEIEEIKQESINIYNSFSWEKCAEETLSVLLNQ